ncbi:hypothetical protein [Streptomyces sp. NBC_01216]|uniref:hypothetical protein n=1 Tax=unclassified Streptomyces TaxID=2593676 RepID=UPI002E0EEC8C|nr:hypothetical protein OG393_01260 [Streptomyces sp. NBC_01216]
MTARCAWRAGSRPRLAPRRLPRPAPACLARRTPAARPGARTVLRASCRYSDGDLPPHG